MKYNQNKDAEMLKTPGYLIKVLLLLICFTAFGMNSGGRDNAAGSKNEILKSILNSCNQIQTDLFSYNSETASNLCEGYTDNSGSVQYAFLGFGKKDTDGDGIADESDSCPNDAEDFDGFEDDDGCPELDNDKDGIPDKTDKCPLDAEDLDGYLDADGCPENDNDGDGIKDTEDKCPNEPEDTDGVDDTDGCPENDNDGDGIQDIEDKCPDEAEDFDGWLDKDGCPENDNDGDGLEDELDKCPDQAESFNGFEDNDGCPDAVILKKDERIILDNIYFKLDSAELEPESFETLNSLKIIFLDNPGIVVEIEGHTSNDGSDDYNLDLSERRAKSVADYIVNVLGVSSGQISSVGYGESKPIANNGTSKGRAQNRRIEFRVVSNGK
jgi:outer membrane protein OmpA-like peptidoglycan-associated protein